MTEDQEKNLPDRATIKVAMRLLVEMKNEQNRLLNSGEAVSLAELADKAWGCYNKSRYSPGDTRINRSVNYSGVTLLEAEFPWIHSLIKIMRGNNADARNALMTNIVAFAGYAAKVPEVPSVGLSIDALESRLIALEQQILDEGPYAALASTPDAPQTGGSPAGKTRKKRA